MEKIDFKKTLKHLYLPSAKKIEIVDVPEMQFLMIDGKGNPNTAQEYMHALEALYGLAFTLKFMLKKHGGTPDYSMPPLEGLWWAEDMSVFVQERKEEWIWTMMIMQPDFVTKEMVEEAAEELQKKKDPAALPKIRLESYHEGVSAQTMHIGPYSAEAPTIRRLHDFIEESGYRRRGKHHEVYLSDPRRAAPEKMKTVIRQPMESSSKRKTKKSPGRSSGAFS